MAALPDVANFSVVSNLTGPTIAVNTTCAAADNCLIAILGSDATTPANPTAMTYNSVAMTPVGSPLLFNNEAISFFYLFNPPTGSALSLSATWGYTTNAFIIMGVPIAGANTGIAPTLGTPATGTSASIACSGTLGTANDVYLGATMNRGTAQTPGSAPQTLIQTVNAINTAVSAAASYITAGNPGNFTWAITSGNWAAIALLIKGATSSTPAAVLTPPSTTIAASTTAAASAFAPNTQAYAQIKISNQTTSWAFVNFGVAGSVNAATVATSLPIAPGMDRTVSIDPEVTGASVILATGSGSVVFSPLFWPHYA